MRMGTRARIHTKTTTGGTFAAEIAAAEARAACPTGRPLGNAALCPLFKATHEKGLHQFEMASALWRCERFGPNLGLRAVSGKRPSDAFLLCTREIGK